MIKTCSKCKESKDVSLFSRNRAMRDGYSNWCKPCCSDRARERYKDPMVRERMAARCREYEERHKEKRAKIKKARYEANKDEWNARARKWHKDNPERVREKAKRYREKHPEKYAAQTRTYNAKRRSVVRSGVSSSELKDWTMSREKICHWCEAPCDESFHIDHYYPISKGGRHELDNLVISCPSCNLEKRASDPIEFAHTKGRLF